MPDKVYQVTCRALRCKDIHPVQEIDLQLMRNAFTTQHSISFFFCSRLQTSSSLSSTDVMNCDSPVRSNLWLVRKWSSATSTNYMHPSCGYASSRLEVIRLGMEQRSMYGSGPARESSGIDKCGRFTNVCTYSTYTDKEGERQRNYIFVVWYTGLTL